MLELSLKIFYLKITKGNIMKKDVRTNTYTDDISYNSN